MFLTVIGRAQSLAAPQAARWGLELPKPTVGNVMAGVGALSAAYLACKAGSAAASKARILGSWIASKWRKPLALRPASTSPRCGESVLPESAVPGSEERSMTFPKGQVIVGFQQGGSFHVVGCAVRIDQWLVVPDHVKSAVSGDIKLELLTADRKRRLVLTDAEMDSFVIVDTDILACQLSEARFSEAGLGKPSICPTLSETVGGYVAVVGAYGKGTTGTLRHSTLFGKVVYSGSTFKGYSGAAYMLGSQLAGVHLHGGTVNAGYSSSYLLAMLKHMFKIKDEDTAEWLDSVKRAGATVEVDPEWRDLDECRVRVNGRYHILPQGEMARAYGLDWRKGAAKKTWRTPQYEDPESATGSGEATSSLSGASASSVVSAPSLLDNLSALTPTEWKRLNVAMQVEGARRKLIVPDIK